MSRDNAYYQFYKNAPVDEDKEVEEGKNHGDEKAADIEPNWRAAIVKIIGHIWDMRKERSSENAREQEGGQDSKQEAGIWDSRVEGGLVEDLVEVGQDLLGLRQHQELLDVVTEAARGVEHCLQWERCEWQQRGWLSAGFLFNMELNNRLPQYFLPH